jgi:hypothetical protein
MVPINGAVFGIGVTFQDPFEIDLGGKETIGYHFLSKAVQIYEVLWREHSYGAIWHIRHKVGENISISQMQPALREKLWWKFRSDSLYIFGTEGAGCFW